MAAAPLLYCGGETNDDNGEKIGADGGTNGKSSGGSRNGSSGSTTGSGSSTGTGGSTGSGSSTGTGGSVSTGSGAEAGSFASGGEGGASGATGQGGFPCLHPRPSHPEHDTGFEECDGFKHRPEIVACPSLLPRPPEGAGGAPNEGDACQSDADCTDQDHGYCDEGSDASRFCSYGCTTDADCGENSVCLCGYLIGRCVMASCKSDAECGDGLLCATYGGQFCDDAGFACQHPADECVSEADCNGRICEVESDGVRRCSSEGCSIVGRPFLVGDSLRVAPAAPRSDWTSSEVELDPVSLSAEEREALGAAWLKNALMEHASVAAFARFTLELLAVGAPAELIRDSNAAASDETRHAELCFALASEYLGEAVGPGPLKIDGALDGISLEKLVVTAIAEGCIGETVAAVEAAEQLAHASDSCVRAVLGRISEDETRHAELAWRFVAWALERDPSLRGVVEREFSRHLSAPKALVERESLDLTRHGVLSERARSELRSAVLDGVIRDAAQALSKRAPVRARARDERVQSMVV